jgi:hypothetical protein
MDYHYLSSSGKCVFRGFGVSSLTARARYEASSFPGET